MAFLPLTKDAGPHAHRASGWPGEHWISIEVETARTEFAEGWGVLIASAVGFGLGLSGLPFYTMSVFVEPLGATFHWSLAEIQGGLTIMLFSNVATLPAAAWLATQFGGRRVGLASVILFALSFMSLAGLNGSLADYYLHWVVMSAAGAGTLAVTWTQVISTWFVKARGTALGIAMMGTGVTAVLAPTVGNALIGVLGWRGAYLALGASPLLMALPLVWFLFKGRGEAARAPASIAPRAIGRVIVSNWRFWLIGAAFLLVGAAVAGMIPNLVKLLRSLGLTKEKAAGVASLVGLFVIFGRAGAGALLDRLWAPVVAAAFFGLASAGCVLLLAPHLAAPWLWSAAIAIGLAAGAEFDVLPYLASRYFGVERVGLALGWLSMFFYVGAAMGPWGIADLTGSYDLPHLIAAAFFALGGCSLLTLGRYPANPP
jgi:MFS family permease